MFLKSFLTFILCCLIHAFYGQVTFIVQDLPDYTPPEGILYIAGNFTGWQAGLPEYALQKNDEDKWSITLEAEAEGTNIEYKFTLGSWETVEKGASGEEIANRTFSYGNGETVMVEILNWAEDEVPLDSTATWNVSIMHEDFYMPQLDRTRRIWLYLPPDYHTSNSRYPVIYMHDGQNLFEQLTSFSGEWEVDETLNALADSGYQVPIVIGIDNGGVYRTEELTPWEHESYPTGRGADYMAFIVETLKPHVDSNYRTQKGRNSTAIMGSSLGGLISTYGALKYQDVFSKSGPFSPAYWINYDSIFAFVSDHGMQSGIRFYQNSGENEGEQYIDMMNQMEDSLKAVGFEDVTSTVIPGGDHNEATWKDDFAHAYLWLFQSFASDVRSHNKPMEIMVAPNPASSELTIENLVIDQPLQIRVFDLQGQVVANQTITENKLDISRLPSGYYALRFSKGKADYMARFIKQ